MTHFEWWDKVGSGMPPLDGEDAHEHVQRVTAACWDAARAAIYDAEAAQLTAPLRERLAHAEHCNEGDCHYYGQKRPASCACSRA